MRNSFTIKLLVLITSIVLSALAIILAIFVLKHNNTLYYHLDGNISYQDEVIIDFDSYKMLVKKYQINKDLNSLDFENNSYIASFQEYDKCSEKKVKSIDNIGINTNNIDITYHIYNKCGFCKKTYVLYLIKIDKLNKSDYKINYKYNYDKDLNCGNI